MKANTDAEKEAVVRKLLGDRLPNTFDGDFAKMWEKLRSTQYTTKLRSSADVQRCIRPLKPYGPPLGHPDRLDGGDGYGAFAFALVAFAFGFAFAFAFACAATRCCY